MSHEEYFQLYAFFNNTAEKPLDGNKYEYPPRMMAPGSLGAWHQWDTFIEDADVALDRIKATLATNALPEWGHQNTLERLTAAAGAVTDTNAPAHDLVARMKTLQARWTSTLVAQELPKPRDTKLLHRGEYDQPTGETLQPDVSKVLGPFPEHAPRKRLGLAQWLTAREHPLGARVLINRIWQCTFGDALVRTPGDFGLQGEHPTHPESQDWLAVELQDSGWDLKHMLRLMVTSATFRQASAWRADVEDPQNRLFASGPGYRMDAEVLRDMALTVSGMLEPTMGGEGVKPYQPDGLWSALMHPASNTKKYVSDTDSKAYRRSLYVYWKRTSPHPMMTLFDAPSRESNCVWRSRSDTPLQSLGLLNENQRIEMARGLGMRLLETLNKDKDRLAHMFRLVAARAPTDAESNACYALLNTVRTRYAETPADALALLGNPAPDTLSFDAGDIAAWTAVAAAVLASDIAILMY